ncbi:MAG: hypothetical protein HYR94_07135 [Chloroflexi bacterium]|nr:hypothetical protein [Chloroflexota bacterium]
MKWLKRGQIFKPTEESFWAKSHAMAPAAVLLNDDFIRVYVGSLDATGISRIGYVDVQADNPTKVIRVSKNPIVDLGQPGTFDDNGVFPAHAARINQQIYLYYTGFQLGDKVRYFMFGGLAISDEMGEVFQKVSEAPIMDRAPEGLFFEGALCLIRRECF